MGEEYEERTMAFVPDTSVPSSRMRAEPQEVHMKTLKAQEHHLMLTGPEGEVQTESDILIDALPYIDLQYSDGNMRASVEKLIAEEMGRSTKAPEEYLAESGMAEEYEFNSHDSVFLQTEWDRVSQNIEQTPMDTTRYKVEPPPEAERDSLEAWQKAVDNAYAQLEHTNTRIVNLELMTKFGPNAWRTYSEQLQSFKTSLGNNLNDCKQDIENLHRKRKAEQLQAGSNLRQLETKFGKSMSQANELEGVCSVLEGEVRRLKKRADRRGLKGSKDAK